MSRKTVLHILRSSEYSGAESVVITIIKAFREEYDMVYLSSEGSIREVLEAENIRYVLLKDYTRKNIRRAIEQVQPDIVHAHDYTASVIAASLKKDFLLISHLHNDPLWVRKWNPRTLLFASLLSRIDRMIVVSEAAYQNFVFKKYCKKKVRIIHNPVDKNEICRLAECENSEKGYDLIFCGRMSEQKNPERFIEIVESLVKEGLDVRAVMLGRGPSLESCKQQIAEKQLEKHIDLLGFVNNPYRYMAQSRILCMPSRWEGFGLVAAEANVLGVPVLATRAVGLLEVYGEEPYEYCDTNGDFCRKIRELLLDTQLYEKIKEASLKKVARLADIDLYKKEIEAVYREEKH